MSREMEDRKRPEAFCPSCSVKTPHAHERLAVHGRLVARSVCLACNKERSGIALIEQNNAGIGPT